MNNAANSCALPGKAEKPVKTPEELAQIAFLDRLRSGEGERMPVCLPLACVVKIVRYEELPKAHECYALATVRGPGDREWKLTVNRHYLEEGVNALFVSDAATMPVEERYANRVAARVKLRVFKIAPGRKEYRYLLHVHRNIYRYNCGVLYPLRDFPELKRERVGAICTLKLGMETLAEVRKRALKPQPEPVHRIVGWINPKAATSKAR